MIGKFCCTSVRSLPAASCVFVEDVVYILEGLFKQGDFFWVKIFSLASGIKGRDWGIAEFCRHSMRLGLPHEQFGQVSMDFKIISSPMLILP